MSESVHQEWAAAVGAEFSGVAEDGPAVTLRLDECTPVAVSGGWCSFALTFSSASEHPAPQGTYLLSVAGGESQDVFLVPHAPHDGRAQYEAVFTFQSGTLQSEVA